MYTCFNIEINVVGGKVVYDYVKHIKKNYGGTSAHNFNFSHEK